MSPTLKKVVFNCCLLIFFLLFLLPETSFSQASSQFVSDSIEKLKQCDSIIIWNKYYDLRVNDFQGDNSDITDIYGAKSTISYFIIYAPDSPFRAKVICYFDKKKSPIRPNLVDSISLTHEQTHFNIGELVGREFESELNKIEYSSDSISHTQELQKIYIKIKNILTEYQNKYDLETNYGLKLTEQIRWNAQIKNLLK